MTVSGVRRFSIDAVVPGHHIHKDVWIPVVGEEFMCQQEVLLLLCCGG